MDPTGYPCPACGAPADLRVGCSGCGRPPYPLAAEVIRLDGEIDGLGRQVEQAHRAYRDLAARLADARNRRAHLAARVRAEVPAPGRPYPTVDPRHPAPAPAVRPAVPGPIPPAQVPPGAVPPPGGVEISGGAVQGLLFVLGGLLLGTAAVVFTAVAWAAVGVVGRALILAAVTALVLALPLVAARRRLRGTAETLAAVGLLLVLLDGYAAWAVDLFGVTAWPGTRYTALVGVVGVAFAAGYARLSGLTGPWFWALLTGQPVLPLLAAEARPSATGWTLVFLGTALLNLVVVTVLRDRAPESGPPDAGAGANPPHRPARIVGQVVAGLGYAVVLAVAVGCALVPLAEGRAFGVPALAGLPLLLVVAALGAAAPALRSRGVAVTAAGLAVPVLAAVILRPVVQQWPVLSLLAVVLVAVGLAGAVRLVPERWRTGPRVGALVVAGSTALVTALTTVVFAAATVHRSMLWWRGADSGPDLTWGWQLPVAVLLGAVAWGLLLPRGGWFGLGVAAGALVVLALPAVGPTSWPLVVTLDLVAGVGLLLAAVLRPGTRTGVAVPLASAGAVLVGHALPVALAAPAGAALALAVTALTGLLLASRGRSGSAAQRGIAGVGLAVALVAAPLAVPLGAFAAGVPPWWQARFLVAAVGLAAVALVAVRRGWPDLRGYASVGYAVAVTLAGLVAVVPAADEPVSLYAALGVLLVVLAAPGFRPDPLLRAPGLVLLAVAVLVALPAAVSALVVPYGPPSAVWAGAPAGRPGTGNLPVALALLVLAVAALLAGRGRRGRLLLAWPFAAFAVPVLLTAVGAPWPVVPAVVLLLGTAALLVVALVRPYPALVAGALPVGLVAAGSGLLGLLATRAGTLAGTGVVIGAALAVGVAARSDAVRVLGWVVAVPSAVGFAVTAALAGGLPLRTTAFAVLAVAVLALATAPVLARWQPLSARVLEVLAQAAAGLALLLTVGAIRHAAVVCVLWGTAVAVRVLVPGGSAGRRWVFAGVAGGSELLGAWLLLIAGEVLLVEAYTVPAAVLALAFGTVALRCRTGLTSWLALGPGLAAALLPSLVPALVVADPQPWRRLGLGLAALAVVLVGAVRRWQAPVVLGAVTLTLLTLHELARGWDLLPRWIYLGLGGIVLISVAATYERRRRDLSRLRSAVGRMS
ncbi:SCO7613 C-terminal domain-containing membrane protein [Micromonospora fluostatini]|uniref:SCO7613 C-terminal domain-containing membrane protein n=1 Tax=Micromonospora sp. JCM 30529 TaxID=3421643 RepID=UPI003D176DA3